MPGKAVVIIDFTVTGKLCAADTLDPFLAGRQKRSCYAAAAIGFVHIDALKEAYRAGLAAFHIIVTQLALGKADGLFAVDCEETGCFGG